MGKVFLEFISGTRLFLCASCRTPLTTREEMTSNQFVCSTGQAYLFGHTVNVNHSAVHKRTLKSGEHYVRDVACKNCDARLGWMYEFAFDDGQKYKEGQVILEKKLVKEIVNTVDNHRC